jgi:methanogenic corrinoid protein MtbC1
MIEYSYLGVCIGNPQKFIYAAIFESDETTVSEQVKKAIELGSSDGDILNKTLIPTMAEVGDLFEIGGDLVNEPIGQLT